MLRQILRSADMARNIKIKVVEHLSLVNRFVLLFNYFNFKELLGNFAAGLN
jgi:hypothetical protein